MLPFCYEAGLASGHSSDAAQLMLVATETFIKDVLSTVFSRTRSNAPGASGSTGTDVGTTWIQTHAYTKQLAVEEEASRKGELTRDKGGLLPVEAKAASERGPLGLADMQLAMELADVGLANFPIIETSMTYGYRDGELEHWDDYTWTDEQYSKLPPTEIPRIPGLGSSSGPELTNGHADAMDIDNDMWWEGTEAQDMGSLDSVLDSCLAVGY